MKRKSNDENTNMANKTTGLAKMMILVSTMYSLRTADAFAPTTIGSGGVSIPSEITSSLLYRPSLSTFTSPSMKRRTHRKNRTKSRTLTTTTTLESRDPEKSRRRKYLLNYFRNRVQAQAFQARGAITRKFRNDIIVEEYLDPTDEGFPSLVAPIEIIDLKESDISLDFYDLDHDDESIFSRTKRRKQQSRRNKNKRETSKNNEWNTEYGVKSIVKFSIPAIGVWLCGPLLSLIDTSIVGLYAGTLCFIHLL